MQIKSLQVTTTHYFITRNDLLLLGLKPERKNERAVTRTDLEKANKIDKTRSTK